MNASVNAPPATTATGDVVCGTDGATFVAINFISCDNQYCAHFEQLFRTRAQAIDRMPGFLSMEVLKPTEQGAYLIVSRWTNEAAFRAWMTSPAFREGHERGFAELEQYSARGEPAPLRSRFTGYWILTT